MGWRCRWGSAAPTVSAMPLGRGKTRSAAAFRVAPAPVARRAVAALCGPVPGRFGAVARSGRSVGRRRVEPQAVEEKHRRPGILRIQERVWDEQSYYVR